MKKHIILNIVLIILSATVLSYAAETAENSRAQQSYLDRLETALNKDKTPQTVSVDKSIYEIEPEYIGSVLWQGMADLEIRGDFAYCTFPQGVMQIDISDPHNPIVTRNYDLQPGETWGLDIEDSLIAVANGLVGLSVGKFDATGEFEFIYEGPTFGSVLDVDLVDSIVYMAEGYDGLGINVLPLSGHAFERSRLNTGNAVVKVVARGEYLYLADGQGGLTIVNVADIDNPAIVGGVNDIGFAMDVALSGQYAYVALKGIGLAVINIADPLKPQLVKLIKSPVGANGLTVDHNYLYAARSGVNGLLIYDISLPENPVLTGRQDIAGTVLGVKVSNGLAYAAGWHSGLNIVDVNHPAQPELVGLLATPGTIHTVQTDANTTYVAASALEVGQAGFYIIDWQETGIPKQISEFHVDGTEIYDFKVQGNYAYLTDLRNGLVIVNISDHTNPVRSGYFPIEENAYNISISGNLACVVTDFGLDIIQTSDPANPHLIYQYQTPGKISDLKLVNRLAFLAVNGLGMQILNLDNPDLPEIIGGYYSATKVQNIDVSGNYAYLTDADSGFVTVDISDLSRPSPVNRHDLIDSRSTDLYYADNYVYITSLEIGVLFYNVMNRPDSYSAGSFATRGLATDFTAADDLGYLAEYYGLAMVKLHKPLMQISPAEIELSAYENGSTPFSQYITIENIGGGRLMWDASYHSDWLKLKLINRDGNDGVSGIEAGANISGLSEGVYFDTITITGNTSNLPIIVPVTLTIFPVNHAPQLAELVNHTIDENTPLAFDVTATDEDGTIPNLSTTTLPENAGFIDNQNGSGRFSFTPDYAQAGKYSITFYASENNDPLLTDSAVVTITVDNVNRAPYFNPYYNDTTIIEDDTLELAIQVIDPDNETVIMKVFNLPENAEFDYTDTIGGVATLTFMPDYTQVGDVYPLEIRAVDYYDIQIADTINLTVGNRQLAIREFHAAPPISGIKDILLEDSILIYMNEALTVESLDEYFTVEGAKTAQFNYSYDPENYLITIKPFESEFQPLDTITITLFADLLDLAGQPLGEDIINTVYTGAVVYPGDANNDGSVDERDILPLGIFYNLLGPIRNDEPDCGWGRFPAHQWEPLGGTFADADGSGVVDADDICAISQNWESSHTEKISINQRIAETTASLGQIDDNILMDMYNNLINCEDNEGKVALSEILLSLIGQSYALPEAYELSQNYPNPFNPNTKISYALPERTFVAIQIYDILGRQVNSLVNDIQEAGYYTVEWDGTAFNGQTAASGYYFYRLQTTHTTIAKKMLLLK